MLHGGSIDPDPRENRIRADVSLEVLLRRPRRTNTAIDDDRGSLPLDHPNVVIPVDRFVPIRVEENLGHRAGEGTGVLEGENRELRLVGSASLSLYEHPLRWHTIQANAPKRDCSLYEKTVFPLAESSYSMQRPPRQHTILCGWLRHTQPAAVRCRGRTRQPCGAGSSLLRGYGRQERRPAVLRDEVPQDALGELVGIGRSAQVAGPRPLL